MNISGKRRLDESMEGKTMAKDHIDKALAKVAGIGDDLDKRWKVLERAADEMMDNPTQGAQLLARICATGDDMGELELLADLLGAAMSNAQMAKQSGIKCGEEFLQAIEDATDLASRQGKLDPIRRMMIAQACTRSGAPAIPALELTMEDADEGLKMPYMKHADIEMLPELFNMALADSGGTAMDMYDAIQESFPLLPPETRASFIAWSVSQDEPIHAELSAMWLLDPKPEIRLAAAGAIAERVDFPQGIAPRMAQLRSWMPEDEARVLIDKALRDFMRGGNEPEARIAPWTIEYVVANVPDWQGAQNFGAALRSGKSRKFALILVKQDVGVKNAYLVDCSSKREQNDLKSQVTGGGKIGVAASADCLERAVSRAISDSLEGGMPPHAGLLEIVELCGYPELRPQRVSTEELVSSLPDAPRIRELSAQARENLVEDSASWFRRHECVRLWMELGDEMKDLLENSGDRSARDAALWNWFEDRRDRWTRLIGNGADLLASSGHKDADSFTAVALALVEGRQCKEIPVLASAAAKTVEALT